MVCRGFSLQIMVDIFAGNKIGLQNLIDGYAGKGIHWLLTKRIESLKSMDLISTRDENIMLSSRLALFIGKTGLMFKNLFNLPQGG